MKVLVVDDNKNDRLLLLKILTSNNYEVDEAGNGIEALESVKTSKPNLIISDVMMPDMDGFSFIRELKKTEDFKTIPVVFYSAQYVSEKDKELALKLGVSKYIVKPMEPKDIIIEVEKVLKEYKAGTVKHVEPLIEEEVEYLNEYSKRVVLKLEDKVRELEHESAKRKKAEEELIEYRDHLEEMVKERTAQLEATNKELESFSYAVSHDLKAPLRSIDGFSNILLEDCHDKLDEEGKDYLNRVSAASKKMSHLIDSMLTLSRLTRGELNRVDVDLTEFAKCIASDLQESQPDRKVKFVIAKNVTANGDAAMVQAVIGNLFGNAWKFTGKHPTARIEFGVTEKNGKTVYFVKDDGAGFDPKYSDKLFVPFQRLHTDSEFSGMGIGLATVQRIINRHRGNIWGEGEVEKGATFYFTFE